MKKRKTTGLIMLAMILTFSMATVSAASRTVTIRIEGMHCQNCAASVEKKLKATDGIQAVRVSFPRKEAWVKLMTEGSRSPRYERSLTALALRRQKNSQLRVSR